MNYPISFQRAVRFVLNKEGGYVNHPNDPGGETNFGISKRAYPDVDIKNLTEKDAIKIYYQDYWRPVAAAVKDDRMRLMVFDAAVNHGLRRALEWAQVYDTPMSFMAKRFRFWANLNTFDVFGRGWTRRGAEVLAVSDQRSDRVYIEKLIDHRPLLVRLIHAFAGVSSGVIVNIRPMSSETGLKMDVAMGGDEYAVESSEEG